MRGLGRLLLPLLQLLVRRELLGGHERVERRGDGGKEAFLGFADDEVLGRKKRCERWVYAH